MPSEKNKSSVCEFCQSSHACGTLKSALKVFEKEVELSRDSYAEGVFTFFKGKLADYGYHYPYGEVPCWLADKESVVRDLTNEAIKHINELRKRKSKLA